MKITLTLGSDSLVLKPNTESNRSPISKIKMGQPTATGVSTFEGVTARPDTFIWQIKCFVFEWEYIKLTRMINIQDGLVETSPSTAFMILKDEYQRCNSVEYNKNGRTAVADSALTSNGETTYYSNFKVFANIPEQGAERLNAWVGLDSKVKLTLFLNEVV